MLVIEGNTRTPVILTRLPRMNVMPDARKLDIRIDLILNAEWAREDLVMDGSLWYSSYVPCILAEIADDTGADPDTIAGMLAAMSAGYSWPDSLKHVYTLLSRDPGSRACKAADVGQPILGGVGAGPVPGVAAPYGWRSIQEAEAIRDGTDVFDTLTNKAGETETVKRWNFAHNLMGDFSRVTVDVHMARGLTGGFLDGTPTPKRYRAIADAIKRAAERFDVEPATMQAMLWAVIRGSAH